MKLLVELSEEVQYITEDRGDGKKNLYIEGIFMQCIPNKNGRIYREDVMGKEVNRYLKESVQTKRAYGELNHPSGPQINLDRVSHLIESLKIDGKNVIGKAKVLDTPMGQIVKGLLEGGANLGVSSRGLGSLKEKNGLMEVQEDFRLITAADIVADPSAPDAFVRGIMENVEYYYDAASGLYKERVVEQTHNEMKKMSRKELEERKLRLFEHFLSELSKK